MNSIRDEFIALDTNEFIFALRREARHPDCETLLFDQLPDLKIFMPLQVLLELERNLKPEEMHGVLLALGRAATISWDYTRAPMELIQGWERRGAKKGDAIIAAQIEVSGVQFFISENRHFLSEIADLPFKVLSS